MTLQPFQQRVIDEQHALDAKLRALRDFRNGDGCKVLPHAERVRLELQQRHMEDYNNVLIERIGAFVSEGGTEVVATPDTP